jgi:dihydroorotate dehydrogenase (NAD+) catalytic subunit
MGGIMTGRDAAEFLLCGATCVMVGTANLIEPDACLRIARELNEFLDSQGIEDVNDWINTLIR